MGTKKTESKHPIKIVIMQRNFHAVGRVHYETVQGVVYAVIEGGSFLRQWGTTQGSGEIALGGPTKATRLYPAATLRLPVLSYVFEQDCDEAKWAPHIREVA
jgi:hypothetical protein